jgi:hypothetical protein
MTEALCGFQSDAFDFGLLGRELRAFEPAMDVVGIYWVISTSVLPIGASEAEIIAAAQATAQGAKRVGSAIASPKARFVAYFGLHVFGHAVHHVAEARGIVGPAEAAHVRAVEAMQEILQQEAEWWRMPPQWRQLIEDLRLSPDR